MAGASNPTLILIPWANSASSTYVTSPIPEGSQQPNPRASYTDGFPPQTVGATGTPPDIRDFNGALKDATSNIVAFTAGQYWGFQSGVATQNSGYAAGAILATADGSGFWVNTSAGNTNNPDTTAAATSGWAPVSQYGIASITGLTNANVTLTAPQAGKALIILSGALTGNVQIIFPNWTKSWVVQNNTTGAYSVTLKTGTGTGLTISPGAALQIFGDGTNIYGANYATGTFTAGTNGGSGVTTSVTWIRNGNTVTLSGAFPNTSYNVYPTLTGVPASLTPSTNFSDGKLVFGIFTGTGGGNMLAVLTVTSTSPIQANGYKIDTTTGYLDSIITSNAEIPNFSITYPL